jgi:ATP-binding cassette, subfamily C (CFTR/MRP), member 1
MKNGQISEFGTYQELLDKKGEFSKLLNEYGGISSEQGGISNEQNESEPNNASADVILASEISLKSKGFTVKRSVTVGKKLIEAEDRAIGTLKNSVFTSFMVAMGGVVFLIILAFSLISTQVSFHTLFINAHDD